MAKTIISACLTGAGSQKSANPALPVTPREIAEDAILCHKAGAAIVHLHMRDENMKGTMDKARFREAVERIRDNCDAIINLTSSGEAYASDERRLEHIIELKPEMATFDAGTFNWGHRFVFENTPQFLNKLGAVLREYSIKPEVEAFDSYMIHNAVYMQKQGILEAPLHIQFILGVNGGAPGTVDDLAHMYSRLPEGCTWSCSGIGKAHLPMLFATIALGGHVRVGLEDNLYYDRGVPATNVMLVERAARVAREFNNEIATSDDAREILGLRR